MNYIKLGANIIEYASEFRLYLRSQTAIDDDDDQLTLVVTSVDLTLEWAGVLDYFTSALVNSERPDTEEKIQLTKQMTAIGHQLEETEHTLLNLLSQSENGWIEDDQVKCL